MELGELIDRVRDQYIAAFEAAIALAAETPGVTVLTEVALRNESGEAVGEGILNLPLRIDIATVTEDGDPETRSLNSDQLLQFDPVEFDWSDTLRVTLSPFTWDNVTLIFPAPPESGAWGPFIGWYREWFREEEDGVGELLGVVHFLSDPAVEDGLAAVITDLGSAPVEAFKELLNAVAELGVSEVTIRGAE